MATLTIRPTGPGSSAEFTPSAGANWENVDDVTPDGDTTYNSGDSGVIYDLFVHNTSIPDALTYNSVTVYLNTKVLSTFGSLISYALRTHSTSYVFSAFFPTTNYAEYSQVFTTNPDTGLAWTKSELEDLEFGYYNTYISAASRVSQIYVVLDYTPDNKTTEPGVKSVTTSRYAPTVSVAAQLTPGVVNNSLTGYTPSVQVSDNKRVEPAILAVIAAAKGVGVVTQGIVLPESLSVVTTGLAPTVAVSNNQSVTPSTASFIVALQTLTISISRAVIVSQPGNIKVIPPMHLSGGRARRNL